MSVGRSIEVSYIPGETENKIFFQFASEPINSIELQKDLLNFDLLSNQTESFRLSIDISRFKTIKWLKYLPVLLETIKTSNVPVHMVDCTVRCRKSNPIIKLVIKELQTRFPGKITLQADLQGEDDA